MCPDERASVRGSALALGLERGEGVGDGAAVGEDVAKGAGAVTCRVACAWHVVFQQIRTIWSPAPMSRGMVTSRLTFPAPSDLNGKTLTGLSSWISPSWLAGRRVALTTTWSPAWTGFDDSDSAGGCDAA